MYPDWFQQGCLILIVWFVCCRRLLHYRIRQKRQTLQDMTRPLKQWLYHHRDNPYPSKSEKQMLASQSQMTLTQVSNWFANARRRLKNTVKGSEMTWARRIKLYNNCLEGNQERLSISSEDEGSLKGSEMEGFQKPGQPDEVALPLKLAQSPQAATQIEEMDSTSNGRFSDFCYSFIGIVTMLINIVVGFIDTIICNMILVASGL